jgi:hypothetical protein
MSVADLTAERRALIRKIGEIRSSDPEAVPRAERDALWIRLNECDHRIRAIDEEIAGTVATSVEELVGQLCFMPALYRADLEAADRLVKSLVAGVTRLWLVPPAPAAPWHNDKRRIVQSRLNANAIPLRPPFPY